MTVADRVAVRDLTSRLRRLSNAWTMSEHWHPQLARVVIAVLGDREIKFLTGTPGISVNALRREGRVLFFTDDLLAIVTITHEEMSNPTTSLAVHPRRLLKGLSISDSQLVLGAPEDVLEPSTDGWPQQVPINLIYDRLGEMVIPLTGSPDESASSHQLESLSAFLPSLLDDIAKG